MPANRILRIEEEIKRALSDIISNEVKDDRLADIVSVTKVEVTNDLKYAKVFVSIYDTDKKRASSIDALTHATGFIKSRLAKAVNIRRVPELAFKLDDSVEYGIRIAKLLDDAKAPGQGNEGDA